jgi:hypothetical protein
MIQVASNETRNTPLIFKNVKESFLCRERACTGLLLMFLTSSWRSDAPTPQRTAIYDSDVRNIYNNAV